MVGREIWIGCGSITGYNHSAAPRCDTVLSKELRGRAVMGFCGGMWMTRLEQDSIRAMLDMSQLDDFRLNGQRGWGLGPPHVVGKVWVKGEELEVPNGIRDVITVICDSLYSI